MLPAEAVVVNKSTVPVGSTRVVERALGRADVVVVSNPEFLREGSAVHDFLNPDRIVIGADDQAAAIRVASLYLGVTAPLIVTDPASAETIKYAANAFLATKISFVNAIAAVCEAVGADVNDVVLGMGYDKRIGHEFLKPGPGWGGSCFPKDTRALVHIAEDAGYDFDLLKGVITVNEEQFDRVVAKVARRGRRRRSTASSVGVWGLTFKARTDDLRDSPSLADHRRLLAERAPTVRAYDPAVDRRRSAASRSAADPYAACDGADVLVVLTEWDEFRWLDFDKVAGADAAAAASSTPATCSTAPRSRGAASPTHGIGALMAADRRHRRAPGSSARTCATRCSHRGDEVVAIDNLRHRVGSPTSSTSSAGRASPSSSTTSASYVWVPGAVDAVMHFASPASPADYLEHPDPDPEGRQPRHAQHASAWPRPRAPGSSWPRRARSTATRRCTRSPRRTGAT